MKLTLAKSTLLLFLCFGFIQYIQAAHLIGGEISYTCTPGNAVNSYDIKLRVYRDCGGNGAPFDTIAEVAVYDINNNLIMTLSSPKGPTIQVSTGFTGNPCASAPPALCSEYSEYNYTAILPIVLGGYTLVHQRCCRNNTISNVNNSGSFGNTYSINIPSMDLTCNSSPQIVGVPPVTLCLGIPTTIPINATDPDGDSLFFEFCEIFTGGGTTGGGGAGGTCSSTTPSPPCPPPFNPVPLVPPFTSSAPLPGNPAFTLDPNTGTLTGTSNQLGQYVVGICVSEYRGNLLLSEVRLDYQFNFASCVSTVTSDIVTQIEDPTLGCDGFTIDFTNQSTGATGYLWDFGDPNSITDTSTLYEPTYTYPGPGTYTVTMIAEPGAACADTIISTFTIRQPISPTFTMRGITCFEGLDLDFSPNGAYPPGTKFEWDFGPDARPMVSFKPFVEGVTWDTPGKHYINLKVTANGCQYFLRDSIQADAYTVNVYAGEDTLVSRDKLLNLFGTGASTYLWSSNESVGFNGMTTNSVTVEFNRNNSDTVSFYLLGTDHNGCQGLDTVLVFLEPNTDAVEVINLFTPNGDGLNETFDLNSINPDLDCELIVLNRWGTEVYYQAAYDNAWTGISAEGDPLPDGTYYYILRCDKIVVQKNAVTIMRNAN